MLRELDAAELELVSGGGTIIVERDPLYDPIEDELNDNQFTSPDLPDTGDTPEEGGELTLSPCQIAELNESDEEKKDDRADEIANEINSSNPVDPITGAALEQGAIIYVDPTTGQIMRTSVESGLPGTVNVALPPGVTADDVIGFVHSHPTAPTTGDSELDAKYDAADRYPSPADWDQMDALVDAGADPNTLSFYVIDKNGDMRQYDYSDKAIYDVPEGQLLGDQGAPPPVPAPEDTTEDSCPEG